ncbi:MAG: FtsX-like permease family protein [Deltaproteobacteria bacterium]|nr:FtsX-like permease family protein [Deltaproteobacteria bacterium]
MTNVETMNLIAAASVSGVFFFAAFFALTVSAQNYRNGNLGLGVFFGLVAGPISALVTILKVVRQGVPDSIRTRGGSLFAAGADGLFSHIGFFIGLLTSLGSILSSWALGKFALDLSGEPLQGPIIVGLVVGGFLGGWICAAFSKRVSFLEVLFIAAISSTLVLVGKGMVFELFTYGTAPAYFAVVLLAANMIHLLALILGGALGYLFTGDGKLSFFWGYESYIARRFLRGKQGNNVVGMITVMSVLGVAVGTCAMIVVMSVMNGFSTDLRSKIFGSNAHLLVLKYGTDFSEHEDAAARTRKIPGIVGASPFILNEVMASSDVNLTGALLKGIDVNTIDQVSVLRKNVIKGDLGHVLTPQKIPTLIEPNSNEEAKKEADAASSNGKGDVNTLPPKDAPPKDAPPKDAPPKDAPPKDAPPKDAPPIPSEADAALDAAMAAATGMGEEETLLPGVVIGQEMSRNLKVFVGDVVNVVSPVGELGPTGPVPKARAFRVAAIFYSGMYEYDSKFIYIALAEAQSFFSLKKSVTGIEYKVDDTDAVQGIARGVLKELGGYPYRTKDWMEMNRNLFSALKLEKIAMFIILTFIILVASFLITTVLIVFVIEKSKEIAILKSMGASDTSIMKVFVVYGVTVGTLGAITGLVLGLGVCFAVDTFGIGLDPDVYYIENLPVHVNSMEVIIVVTAAIFLSFLATIYPALLAARMRPVEGLRFE